MGFPVPSGGAAALSALGFEQRKRAVRWGDGVPGRKNKALFGGWFHCVRQRETDALSLYHRCQAPRARKCPGCRAAPAKSRVELTALQSGFASGPRPAP